MDDEIQVPDHLKSLYELLGYDRLATTIINRLAKDGITTAKQLRLLTPSDLLEIQGIGQASVNHITESIRYTDRKKKGTP